MDPLPIPAPAFADPAVGWFAPALDRIEAMARAFIAELPQFLLGLITFWAALRLARWGRDWAQSLVRRSAKSSPDAVQAIGQLTYGGFVVVGVAAAAAVMGIGLGHVLAGIGVSGIVAGFAFKDILENYLAGILLLLTRPFHIGDAIRTGDYEGVVRSISTRSTVIETFDGQMVVVPNSRIYSAPLVNHSALPDRRASLMVKFPSERDFGGICETLRGVLAATPGVHAEPAPEILLVDLDEKTMQVEIRYWTARTDVASARSKILSAIRDLYGAGTPAV